MNDLRRTLLWSVFAVSLLMLWDGWLRHTGQPSLFSPAAVATAPAADAASASGVPAAVGTASGTASAAPGVAPGTGASAPEVAKGELITVNTDVVQATIDTLGASLVKVELLKHQDQDDHARHMVVLDRSASHTYVAQTGLVGSSTSRPLPC